jgi:two-component system chemotaxis response regulator CheY
VFTLIQPYIVLKLGLQSKDRGFSMAKGKILIVDDEQDVRDIYTDRLEKAGYNPIVAKNGEEAISLLRSGDNMINVGLILCDIRMPKVNGIECISFLRQEAPGIPIVVVTGYPDPNLANSLIEQGVKEFLVKPVDKDKMLDVINKIVIEGKDFALA